MLLLLLISLAFSKPAIGVTLNVVPDQHVFELGKPVHVSLKFENKGNIPLFADTRLLPGPDENSGREITVLLTGPGERPVPYRGLSEPSDLSSADIGELFPKRVLSKTLSLSDVFTLTDPGTYLLQVIYNTLTVKSARPFWRGRIVSPPVTFSISTAEKKDLKASLGTSSKIPEESVLYTPPFLYSSESYFKLTVWSDGAPVSKVPISIAQSKETGYIVQDSLTTDKNGEILVHFSPSASALLVIPSGTKAPFPHRIPILPTPPTDRTGSSPDFISLPSAVESQTEQAFTGTNLLLPNGKTSLTMNGTELAILALSPSYLLTRIPSRLPMSQTFKVTTDAGSAEASIPMVVLHGELEKKSLARGEHSRVTLQEWGLGKIRVWVAADHPRLVFEDGSHKKIVELTEKTPMTIPVKGNIPGSFQLSFGVVNPFREEALGKLEALESSLASPGLLHLLEQASWAVEQGEIGKAESLIEQLRYEAMIQENKALPTDEILPLLR